MGAGGRHGRIDAVASRFVARCGYHRTRPGADDDWLAFQPGIAGHFQRGVESIHIDMQHGAAGLVMTPIALGGLKSRCGAHAHHCKQSHRDVHIMSLSEPNSSDYVLSRLCE